MCRNFSWGGDKMLFLQGYPFSSSCGAIVLCYVTEGGIFFFLSPSVHSFCICAMWGPESDLSVGRCSFNVPWPPLISQQRLERVSGLPEHSHRRGVAHSPPSKIFACGFCACCIKLLPTKTHSIPPSTPHPLMLTLKVLSRVSNCCLTFPK